MFTTDIIVGLKLNHSQSSGLRLRLKRGVFTCVGWQVTLCDPVASDTP